MKRSRFSALFEFSYTLYRLRLIEDTDFEDFFEALLHYWRQHDRATGGIGIKQTRSDGIDLFGKR